MNDYIKQPPYAAGTGGENVLDSSSLFFDNLTRWQINDNLYYLTSKDLSYLFVSGFGVFLSKKSERLVIKYNDKYVYEIPFFRLKNIVILSVIK